MFYIEGKFIYLLYSSVITLTKRLQSFDIIGVSSNFIAVGLAATTVFGDTRIPSAVTASAFGLAGDVVSFVFF